MGRRAAWDVITRSGTRQQKRALFRRLVREILRASGKRGLAKRLAKRRIYKEKGPLYNHGLDWAIERRNAQLNEMGSYNR